VHVELPVCPIIFQENTLDFASAYELGIFLIELTQAQTKADGIISGQIGPFSCKQWFRLTDLLYVSFVGLLPDCEQRIFKVAWGYLKKKKTYYFLRHTFPTWKYANVMIVLHSARMMAACISSDRPKHDNSGKCKFLIMSLIWILRTWYNWDWILHERNTKNENPALQ